MPVFHTKTIESILEPVAFQVSRLVILHEEAEDGSAMPDLSRPVEAVSRAVENLAKVGKDTINRSEDEILRADLPNSLYRVERAAKLLEQAAQILNRDPFSAKARHLLLEGSRGILQGTSSLLLCFDESEVRKLIRVCREVLNYMEVVEVIEKMDDLVRFVRDLSPSMARMQRDVAQRQLELTHQAHRETLLRCLDNLKQENPVLISSMKIYIQLFANNKQSASLDEAIGNRNYHTTRICEDIEEIIRVLQLTTYDEDEWDSDSVTCMKRALGAMTGKLQSAHDWLEDARAPNGGIGEKSLRQLLEHARRIAGRALPADGAAIRRKCSDISAMADALRELRASGGPDATGVQAQTLARQLGAQLRELLALCTRAVADAERAGSPQPAQTLMGRADQAQRWLDNLNFDDRGLGKHACRAQLDEARKLATGCHVETLERQIIRVCDECEQMLAQLTANPNPELARDLQLKMRHLRRLVQVALLSRVADDYMDAVMPLRQFTEIVTSTNKVSNTQFNEKARSLIDWSRRASQTGRHVGANRAQNKRLAEAITKAADRLESQTPQVIGAGKIRFEHSDSQSAHENFMHMRDQYESIIVKLRNLIDEAVDGASFVHISLEAIKRHTQLCELAISTRQVSSMVDNAAAITRLANRVIMVARQETNNSEDDQFAARVDKATRRLQELMPTMVSKAREVATSISDIRNHGQWRQCNAELIEAVEQIAEALGPSDLGDLSRLLGPNSRRQFEKQETRTTTTTTTTHHIIDNNNSNTRPSSGYKSSSPHTERGRNYVQQPQQSQPQHYHQQQPHHQQPQYQQPQPQQYHYQQPQPQPQPQRYQPQPHQQPHLQQAHQNQYPDVMDDDVDDRFPTLQPNQPIMMAAHDLHQEVRQWSSKENEIIAAAKKIALLMARLSQLVRGEAGTKKDLISCAKAIADASQEVTRLAKEQAKLCTDRKMRTNILQVCERIPTMGTQLRILSTVKATMLGVQGSQEDQEAMDMIVGNAQNLMQSIKETVRSCEAASIKIRTDQGVQVRWIRKEPWYT